MNWKQKLGQMDRMYSTETVTAYTVLSEQTMLTACF